MNIEQTVKFDKLLKDAGFDPKNAFAQRLKEFIEDAEHEAYCRGSDAASYNDSVMKF